MVQSLIVSGSSPTFCTNAQSHLVCCPISDNEERSTISSKKKENPCDKLRPLGSGDDKAENS